MGWLEYLIVTPSHHRVHHAINPDYVDKNYAAIFIVWDKWFGTFQEELSDEPPVYGTLKPVSTWNPILINFQHLWGLWKENVLYIGNIGHRRNRVVNSLPIDRWWSFFQQYGNGASQHTKGGVEDNHAKPERDDGIQNVPFGL